MARREPSRVKGILGARARDALFDLAADAPRLVEVDLAAIRPNPGQPRRQMEETGLLELARSIERHGLLQPILVKEAEGGGYLLVAGQRRLLAHGRLGRERIAALIVTGAPEELALIENLQRQDLAPLDEAEALAALQARHGYSQDELARVMAKAKSTISELLSLNSLSELIKSAVRTSEPVPPKSLLVELAREADPSRQEALWRRMQAQGGVTVRAMRAAKGATKRTVRTSEPAAAGPALVAGRQLLRRLERLKPETVSATPALAGLLDKLRDRLNLILGE